MRVELTTKENAINFCCPEKGLEHIEVPVAVSSPLLRGVDVCCVFRCFLKIPLDYVTIVSTTHLPGPQKVN